MAACVSAAIAAAVSVAGASGQPEPPDRGRAARVRHAAKVEAITAMHAGDHIRAREHFASMVSNPVTIVETVEGHRMLALSHRLAGEVVDAAEQLQAATAAHSHNPAIEAQMPGLGAAILMDRAELAAFHQDNVEAAIALYDQVADLGAAASPRDGRLARQNAAVLCADAGRYPDACRRLDELLASAFAGSIPADEVRGLRCSQVFWYAQQGNLEEAMRRGAAVWNDNLDVADPRLADVGVTLAQWHPVPSECAARSALLLGVLTKIDAVRASPADPSDLALAHSVESEVLAAIADSADCQDAELIRQALQRRRR